MNCGLPLVQAKASDTSHAAHEMAGALGPERCIALPFVHAFSGCDTVSSFAGRGKKTVWEIWKYSMRSLQHSASWHQIHIPALLAITLKY